MTRLKSTNFDYDNTMVMIGKMHAVTPGTTEGNGIESILRANGLREDISLLTPGDLMWLLGQAVNLGKAIGSREERTRRRNGKKNTNR